MIVLCIKGKICTVKVFVVVERVAGKGVRRRVAFWGLLDLIRLESSSPYHILYPDQSSSATEITRVSGQARKVKLLVCVCMPGGVWVCVKGETHGMGVWFARNNRQVRSEKI